MSRRKVSFNVQIFRERTFIETRESDRGSEGEKGREVRKEEERGREEGPPECS